MNPKLKTYLPLVKFLAEICGPHFEVILHDLSDMEHSIVAGENLHVTGRKIGDCITNFALDIVFNDKHKNQDYICNYKTTSPDGLKTLKSSTFYIKDKNGKIIGLICTNYDITLENQMKEYLDLMTSLNPMIQNIEEHMDSVTVSNTETEKFLGSREDLIHDLIQTTLDSFAVPASRMLTEEKKEVVKILYQKGTFNLKSAVSYVADGLFVSEPTIYRYLKEINNE